MFTHFHFAVYNYTIKIIFNIDHASYKLHDVMLFVDFNTPYNITVTTKTGGGYGPESVTMVTTLEGAPSSPPTIVELSSVSAFEITMTWRSPPTETLNGILRHYIIEWRGSGGDVSNVTLSGNINTHRFTNLKPFTEYKVRIAAVTVARGPFSRWSTSRTNEYGKRLYESLIDTYTHMNYMMHTVLTWLNATP